MALRIHVATIFILLFSSYCCSEEATTKQHEENETPASERLQFHIRQIIAIQQEELQKLKNYTGKTKQETRALSQLMTSQSKEIKLLKFNVTQLKIDVQNDTQFLIQQIITIQREEMRELKNKMAKSEQEIKVLRQQMTSQSMEIKSLTSNVTQMTNNVQKWPGGHYCILAKGSCPPGFTRHSGHQIALRVYSGTSTYVRAVNIGDSKIKCHGRCGQYGQWTGELYLTGCCK